MYNKSCFCGLRQPFHGLRPSKHCISPCPNVIVARSQMPGCCGQKQAVQLEKKEDSVAVCLWGENIMQCERTPTAPEDPPIFSCTNPASTDKSFPGQAETVWSWSHSWIAENLFSL